MKYLTEFEYQKNFIDRLRKERAEDGQGKKYKAVFDVETQETISGFPDVLAIRNTGIPVFIEMKINEKNRKVMKFQPDQINFMKKNRTLDIHVCIYNNLNGKEYSYTAEEILKRVDRLEVTLDESFIV